MSAHTKTKICGIKTPEALNAALTGGARFIGFVFVPRSPRYLEIDTARELALMLPTGVRAVGLFVDPTDEELEAVLGKVQLDMIQLHGTETPERVQNIKKRFSMPVIKAFPVRTAEDIERSGDYVSCADWFIFDAKPMPGQAGSDLPGGTGQVFDWSLLEGRVFTKPWMLSGGLTPGNVGAALSTLSPEAVDVSSGVEKQRGEKDPEKIQAFLKAVEEA